MYNPLLLWKDRYLRFSAIWALVTLGGFLLWAGFAPLAQGIVGFGKIVVENDRKVIQHLEGGIIEAILVREGDHVKKGEALVVLTDIATLGIRDQMAKDYLDARASVERFSALLRGDKEFIFSADENDNIPADIRIQIINRQEQLFHQQRRTLNADIAVLKSRQKGFSATVKNQQVQIESNENTLQIVRRELFTKKDLLKEGLIYGAIVSELERDEAQLIGETARLKTDQQVARSQVQEIDRQRSQTWARYNEKLATELLEQRTRVSEVSKRLTTATDIINRSTIYAPQAGTIFNLKFTTQGGVVRPSEIILEIVPNDSDLHAIVQINPADRDVIYDGLIVETRLSGLNSWDAPTLQGQIISLSADLKSSANGEFSYYEARISIDSAGLREKNIKAIPGMPIEVFIRSGPPRTFLEYLIEPLSATMRRSAKS